MVKEKDQKIKLEEANALAHKSGNAFHYKIIEFLRKREWDVLISPYYYDNFSDKIREIDIIAEKEFNIDSNQKDKGTINIKLFIECKYIRQPIVFWFDKKNIKKAQERIIADTPLKQKSENKLIIAHHYFRDQEVAKLFTPNKNNDDVIYKAISQSLSSMIYDNEHNKKTTHCDTRFKKELKTINYPLILCNSFDNFFYSYFDEKNKEIVARIIDKDHYNKCFQIEVNYVYLDDGKKSINDYFLIDVIDFNQFDDYLENVLEKLDIDAIRRILF